MSVPGGPGGPNGQYGADAGGTHWSTCVGAGFPGPESLNGLDDDCDGLVDEALPCAMDAGVSCYHAAPNTLGVGACHAGAPLCIPNPDGSGEAVIDGRECVGEVVPQPESCDGIDNDCNGRVDDLTELCDTVDNDCDGMIDEGCPATPRGRMLSRFSPGSGSGIYGGDQVAMLSVVPDPTGCGSDEVRVELIDGSQICVPSPDLHCPPGQQIDYVDDSWRCVECAVVIQYGGAYRGERICAPPPRIRCWDGTVPTFIVETRRWECRPPCDNGQYDRTSYGNTQVCVPC